jgi:hypothetical protein
MCFTLSKIVPHDRWNWDGDRIIHKCIVPSSRPVPGYPPKISSYDIDVREFLVNERNEVMRKTLRADIRSFVQTTRAGIGSCFSPARKAPSTTGPT